MNILLITDSYPPEIRSASHLMQELAEELVHRGHSVSVLTSDPRYNLAENGDNPGPVPAGRSIEKGVEVIRVRTLPHHMVHFIIRGLAQITMPYIFYAAWRKWSGRRMDVVLVYSPPLPLAALGAYFRRRFGAVNILNIQDIFPRNAIDLGALNNDLLIRYFEAMERRAYRKADVVTVHSEGNRSFLIQQNGLPENKFHVLHNWIDLDAFRGPSGKGFFRKEFGLEDKFIFLFAGVMGPSQHLDFVVRIASKLKDRPQAVFLLVGDGTEKPKLMEMARELSLSNVVFKPFIPKEEYNALVQEVDAGLICLSPKNRTPVVPGKILGYMAAGIPVLAFLNAESDGHLLIREAQCGFSAVSDNFEAAVELTAKFLRKDENFAEMGQKGREFAERHFSKERCVDILENFFLKKE